MAFNDSGSTTDTLSDFDDLQKDRLSRPYIIAYLTITGISSLVGVIGNTMTILTFLVTKGLQETKNCFIVNLAVADILVTGIVMPFSIFGVIAGKAYFDEKKSLCRFLATVCAPGCLASMYTICWISCSRYYYICQYGLYMKVFTKRNTAFFILSIWIMCFLVHLPNHVGWGDSKYSTGFMLCTLDMEKFSYSFFYGCCMIAAISATFLFYFKIYRAVRGSKLVKKRLVSKKRIEKDNNQQNHNNIDSRIDIQDEIKLAKTSFKIFIIFVCTWTPTAVLILIGISPLQFIPTPVYLYGVFMAHSNSTVNFFIYYIDNEKFRKGSKALLTKLKISVRLQNQTQSNSVADAASSSRGRSLSTRELNVSEVGFNSDSVKQQGGRLSNVQNLQ